MSIVTIGVILLALTTMTSLAKDDPLTQLQSHLPRHIHAWSATAEDDFYDADTLFAYINGGAELYRAYNMHRCLSRRYTASQQPAIIVDIFDMGSARDAFGIFTHDTDGEVIDIGQDGRLRAGWLSFWQNRFFVSIYMEEETKAATEAVKALARDIAAKMPAQGQRPALLSKLPSTGLDTTTIRFLHHPVVLNYHYYLADDNILKLTPQTDAVLANYRNGPDKARLLLIRYPSPELAQQGISLFKARYLPEADASGIAQLENGEWAAATATGAYVTVVLESNRKKLLSELLHQTQGSIETP